MGDEVAVRSPSDDGNLQAGFTQGGQGLVSSSSLPAFGPLSSWMAAPGAGVGGLGWEVTPTLERVRVSLASSCISDGIRSWPERDGRVLLEIAGCRTGPQIGHVLELVLAEFDDIVVAQKMLLDRLAIDQVPLVLFRSSRKSQPGW